MAHRNAPNAGADRDLCRRRNRGFEHLFGGCKWRTRCQRNGPAVVSCCHAPHGFCLACATRDEQNSDRASRLLAFISFDALTGILNRSFFVDRIRAEDKDGALLIVDADRFKSINDSFGHYSGDIALVQIANAIDVSTPQPGFVGRLGGEEFGVFIPGADLRQARHIAEDVRKAVEALDFSVADTSVPLSVSIGVSLHSATNPVRVAFTHADENLYAAKRGGRNRVATAPSPVHDLQRQIGIAV